VIGGPVGESPNSIVAIDPRGSRLPLSRLWRSTSRFAIPREGTHSRPPPGSPAKLAAFPWDSGVLGIAGCGSHHTKSSRSTAPALTLWSENGRRTPAGSDRGSLGMPRATTNRNDGTSSARRQTSLRNDRMGAGGALTIGHDLGPPLTPVLSSAAHPRNHLPRSTLASCFANSFGWVANPRVRPGSRLREHGAPQRARCSGGMESSVSSRVRRPRRDDLRPHLMPSGLERIVDTNEARAQT
jgi:hypothetical protein